ncbi:MAG: hypothetical protein AUG51_06420 [Acidobacteria bacterium 13_1_20CM_3_53_8]|nr:MAG: hypothetical protein AUG51_06420 [Acidobacteria bacterium 13_1_20CM_3_53_8]
MVLTLSIALLAFCGLFSASNTINTAHAQSQGQVPVEAGGGAPEIIRYRTNPHGADNVTAGSTSVQTPVITYHGGPLLQTPTAYVIWYGNWNQTNGTDNAGGQQIAEDFLSNLGNSGYFNINQSYSTNGFTITGGVNFTRGIYNPSTNPNGCETTDAYSQGSRLRDATVQKVVNNAISSGKLPGDANGVYFVLTSSDVTENSGFCTQYCGWHTGTSSTLTPNGRLRYAFVGNAARCINACAAQSIGPNGNAGVDGMISVVAHELEEATTDPDPRSGWADSGGAENADKCAWTFGQSQTTLPSGAVYNMTLGTRNFLIQRNLSATDSKCYVNASGAQ